MILKSLKIITIVIFISALLPSALSYAQSTASLDTQSIIKQLQEQVKFLMAQVEELKSQIKEVKTELKLTRSLYRGISGDDVKQLQIFLQQKYPEFYSGPITGYFGPLTELAIKKLQIEQGIDSIGVVGPKTLSKLNELITEGAGKSDIIPPGLLIAPGIQTRIGTTTPTASTSSPQAISTTTPSTSSGQATTTPSGTIPATPATSATSATPATPTVTSATPATPATPAVPATTTVPTTATASTTPTTTTSGSLAISSVSITVTPESIGATARATITWNTNIPADSRIEFTETIFPGENESQPEMVTSHSMIKILKSSTTYKYRVKSMAGGNLVISAEFTVTTPARIDIVVNPSDTTPPVISGLYTRRGLDNLDTIIGINWITNEPADNQVEYGLTTSYGSFTNLHNYTLGTSQGNAIHAPESDIGKTYHFRARSKDASGNLGVSGDYTAMVGKTPAPDTTPPVISNLRAENITTSSTQIKWTTNEQAGDMVFWDTSSSVSEVNIVQARCTSGTNYVVTDHCINLTGLLSGTLYYYKVKSGDISSNSSYSGVQQFTTVTVTSTATSTSSLNPLTKNLTAISQMVESLNEILKQLSQLLK